jgi:hypothetical protein
MTAFQQDFRSEERVIPPPDEPSDGKADRGGTGAATRARQLLTFRLDLEFRQRLRARLAGEGRSLSEVVVHGLQLYLQQAASSGDASREPETEKDAAPALPAPVPAQAPVPAKSPGPVGSAVASVADLALPDEVAAALRGMRSSGQSELLSATLAALHDRGWPLRPLAAALGISRQAVLARVRQLVPADVRSRVPAVPPPAPFPRRRSAQPEGRRPHITVKIDQALRAAAHRKAQREGSSLTQVIERILDHYLHHGLPHGPQHGEIRLGDTTPTRPGRRKRRAAVAPGEGD